MPKTMDSIVSAEERSAKIRMESEQREREAAEQEAKHKQYRAAKDAEARVAADVETTRAAAKISEIETRDQLLGHIREMREPPPSPSVVEVILTPRMLAEMKAEQEAGRQAVQRAQEAMDHNREIAAKIAADDERRLGTMVPVHHANPDSNEQFPASGATLGKRK